MVYLLLALFFAIVAALLQWTLTEWPPLSDVDPRRKNCDCCHDEAGNHGPICKSDIDAWRWK